jgi:streptogramin lyase
MSTRPATRVVLFTGAAVVSALLAGCGLNNSSAIGSAGSSIAPLAQFQGKVMGGQQPVSGATLQLYAVGTTGTASAATGLISPTAQSTSGIALTTSTGGFNITGQYSCTSATQVYIVATGGNSGSGTNSALSLMAALGPCSSLSSATFININELTTVSATYALAPYMSNYTHVGASGSNPSGLVNAFNTANLLANYATGASPTPPAGMTLPTTRLNTLADILAACVNSTGASSSGCSSLFGVTSATETAGAALAMAKNPGSASVTALYSLALPTSPYVPTLSAQPNDFTLAINYTGSELASPYGIAIDASGNAWVTNQAGRSVVKAPSPTAAFATTSYSAGGLLAPRGISIDRTGNVWIANTGASNVVELTSAGAVATGSPFSGGGIATGTPVAIANDSGGNAWVANFIGNSITELSSAGAPSGSSPITGTSALSEPTSIALDASGRVAVANAGTGQLCLFSNAGALLDGGCVSDGTLFGATAVAVSGSGNVSLAGSTTGSTVNGSFTLAASSNGTVIAGSPFSGGGLTLPVAAAYDGNGNAWFANNASLSEFSGGLAVSPSAGLGSLNSPAGVAVDPSGNVWTANSGDNSVSIFVGLGTPVATPIAQNVGP